MLFRAASFAALLLLLAAAPEAARAHNHDKAADIETAPNLRVAAKDSDADAVKALTVGGFDGWVSRLGREFLVCRLCVVASLLVVSAGVD